MPLALSANRLASELHVPATRIGEIIHERRGLSTEIALCLARFLGTAAEFRMNLQKSYELSAAKAASLKQIERDIRPHAAA